MQTLLKPILAYVGIGECCAYAIFAKAKGLYTEFVEQRKDRRRHKSITLKLYDSKLR